MANAIKVLTILNAVLNIFGIAGASQMIYDQTSANQTFHETGIYPGSVLTAAQTAALSQQGNGPRPAQFCYSLGVVNQDATTLATLSAAFQSKLTMLQWFWGISLTQLVIQFIILWSDPRGTQMEATLMVLQLTSLVILFRLLFLTNNKSFNPVTELQSTQTITVSAPVAASPGTPPIQASLPGVTPVVLAQAGTPPTQAIPSMATVVITFADGITPTTTTTRAVLPTDPAPGTPAVSSNLLNLACLVQLQSPADLQLFQFAIYTWLVVSCCWGAYYAVKLFSYQSFIKGPDYNDILKRSPQLATAIASSPTLSGLQSDAQKAIIRANLQQQLAALGQ